MTPQTKQCRRCKQTCSVSQFHKDASKKDGLRGCCKRCDTDLARKYRQGNKRRMREIRRAWYQRNKGKVRKKNRKFRESNMAVVLIHGARCRARLKKVPFDLHLHRTKLVDRVGKLRCEVTGMALDPTARRAFNSISLDRKIPAKGYVYSNIQVVAYSVNCALGTWGINKLRELATALLNQK